MAKKLSKKLQALQQEAWAEAINIVSIERTNWEEALCYVTDKVAFRMRELIRTCRKNYWGVFDKPLDSQGQDKIFVPLSMILVEDVNKNSDLDQKDIGFRATSVEGIPVTQITRAKVRQELSDIYFGETLDEDQRSCLIDGTVVWKTWTSYNGKKKVVNRKTVDLLNFYIDPTAQDIQSAYRVTERALLLPEEIKMMDWENTDVEIGSKTLAPYDSSRQTRNGTQTTASYRDVWEMYGKIPKWMVTLDKRAEDANDLIDGHIVISGLESGGTVCHLIEENTTTDNRGNVIKPYEELRTAKIRGRWYGLGSIERILALQEWLNIVTNVRKTRSVISQLGLIKIRKGAGITPQQINNLPVNGVIALNSLDDFQQIPISDVPVSSYKDEEVIKGWAQQVTSAYPVATGEILPASATATSAAISANAAKSSYVLIKEAVGNFLKRWIDRHYLPYIASTIKTGDIVRFTSDVDDYEALVSNIANHYAILHIDQLSSSNQPVPSLPELLAEIDNVKDKLRSNPQLFVKATQEVIASALETEVIITNEELDASVTVKNLLDTLSIAPEYRDAIIPQIFDILGLKRPMKNLESPQQEEVEDRAERGGSQSLTDQLTQANIQPVASAV